MLNVELIYFLSCPNIGAAKAAIQSAGIKNFVEINQDDLDKEHPYNKFSSPTVLVNGEIVAGSRSTGVTCSVVCWDSVSKTLAERFYR